VGVFAQISDVQARDVEDLLSDDTLTADNGWVDTRIDDVENELIGLVPSLQGATAASLAAVDQARAGRVKALVCDKVLDLYRNPGRLKQIGQAMADINTTSTMSNSFDAMIDFTDEELNRVRVRTQRARFGTAKVPPSFGRETNTIEARPWPFGY
jgi:hypothetical protein